MALKAGGAHRQALGWVAGGLLIAAAGWAACTLLRPAPRAPMRPLSSPAPSRTSTLAPPVHRQPAAPAGPFEAGRPLPALGRSDNLLKTAMAGLLGHEAVRSLLVPDDLARRFVVTVDSLAREHAAPRAWPLRPPASSLAVVQRRDGLYLAAANAARYAPFVQVLNSLDVAAALAVYEPLYPLFERAYAELGYSGRHFNERLLEVIDVLLDTPEPAGAIKLVALKPAGRRHPGRRPAQYGFADPALEQRPSGQKILLRMGVDNASFVKAKLAEVRVALLEFSSRH
jgi:hypothetical protein